MKRLTTAVLFLLICLIGCSNHFYRIKDDTLHLYLKEPKAKTVLFSFSKDGYKLHQAVKISSTTWEISVPGGNEFKYFYILDGVVSLPDCRFTENDDFGSVNCIYMPGM